MKKLSTVVAGLTTAGLLALAPVGAANAVHTTHAASTAVAASAPTTGQSTTAKGKRAVTLEGKKTGRVTFTLHGKVTPKYRDKRVFLLFKTTVKGKWHKIRTVKSNHKSGYSYAKVSRVGYYEVMVPRAQGLGPAVSSGIHIYRI